MNRRDFLVAATAAAGCVSAPARVFAQPAPDLRSRAVLDFAKQEIERARPYLWNHDIAGIADFVPHSVYPRFHIAFLESGQIHSFRVCHGEGSDPQHDGVLKSFSNEHGSHATSRGAYLSGENYFGKYGSSMRLIGLDPDNSQALDRAIVMHPAAYAAPAHVERWGRLGRSNGCFAFAPDDFPYALSTLLGGRLLFADRIGFI